MKAVRFGEQVWREPLAWEREAAKSGERARVFCASMADVFEDRADLAPLRARLCDVIARTPHLDWLLLTKRPEDAQRLFTAACELGQSRCVCGQHVAETSGPPEAETMPGMWASNIWVGTTAEDQDAADARVPHLLGVPAIVRFLSCEPLLGPITLRAPELHEWPEEKPTHPIANADEPDDWRYWMARQRGINWLIVGGESGPGARSFDLGWARSLVRQCRAAHVPIFVKQMGDEPRADRDPAHEQEDLRFTCRARRAPKGGDPAEWPEELRVRQFPEVRHAL